MSYIRYNVPGNEDYREVLPLDVVVRAISDQKLRGYWLARDYDGQICIVSNQTATDGVSLEDDEDGTAIISYTDETQEFSYDGASIRVRAYS